MENHETIIYQCQRLRETGHNVTDEALAARQRLAELKAQEELETRIALEQTRKKLRQWKGKRP